MGIERLLCDVHPSLCRAREIYIFISYRYISVEIEIDPLFPLFEKEISPLPFFIPGLPANKLASVIY